MAAQQTIGECGTLSEREREKEKGLNQRKKISEKESAIG
jgi:hypothetical protein